MKKLVFLLMLSVLSVSAQTDVMKFTGKIENPSSEVITIAGATHKQVIPLAKDGSFTATFPIETGIYKLQHGDEYTEVYLKNGFDLNLSMNAQKFDESIIYKGNGEKENNLLARKVLDEEVLESKMMAIQNDPKAMMKLKMEFDATFENAISAADIDPGMKKAYEATIEAEKAQMAKMQEMIMAQQAAAQKMNGNVSPAFEYENHKGGKTKLSDLKGKYVYIDNWATWCGPCLREIPALKQVEEKYHGKNIEFVSISIDTKKDYEKWKKMVDAKKLGGIQLIADKDWNSEFIRAYNINSIPRFILIGPDGKIIDADAKRPSEPALLTQLDALLSKK